MPWTALKSCELNHIDSIFCGKLEQFDLNTVFLTILVVLLKKLLLIFHNKIESQLPSIFIEIKFDILFRKFQNDWVKYSFWRQSSVNDRVWKILLVEIS